MKRILLTLLLLLTITSCGRTYESGIINDGPIYELNAQTQEIFEDFPYKDFYPESLAGTKRISLGWNQRQYYSEVFYDKEGNDVVIVQAGRGLYSFPEQNQGEYAFNYHVDQIDEEDLERAIEAARLRLKNLKESGLELKDYKYKEINVNLLFSDDLSYEGLKSYGGPFAIASIEFPEKSIIVTIYFLNTRYESEDIPLPDFEKVIREIIDNVIK